MVYWNRVRSALMDERSASPAAVSDPAPASPVTGLSATGMWVDRAGSAVVRGVDIEAPLGEVTVLLGANGAGKTTLLDAMSGLAPAREGSVRLAGKDLSGASPYQRARAGICHIEQGRQVFADLTVEENLLAVGGSGSYEAACELFPELEQRRNVTAGSLSGGEQQMLVIARAIACAPKLILADELSLGLAPVIVKRILPVMRTLADRGLGVLLVEQFAEEALKVGDHAYLLAHGEVSFSGSAASLLAQPEVLRRAYLG